MNKKRSAILFSWFKKLVLYNPNAMSNKDKNIVIYYYSNISLNKFILVSNKKKLNLQFFIFYWWPSLVDNSHKFVAKAQRAALLKHFTK